VIGALLKASNGKQEYIDRAVQALDSAQREKKRKYLYQQVSRVLAYNVPNTIVYLKGAASERRKVLVAEAFSDGLTRYGACVSWLLRQFPDLPSSYRGIALAGSLRSEFVGPDLINVTSAWLNGNIAKNGYDAVLSALAERPDRWHTLLASGSLDQRVLDDYNIYRSNPHGQGRC
jgi:hypothetical protein